MRFLSLGARASPAFERAVADKYRPTHIPGIYALCGACAGEGARVPSMKNRPIAIVGFMGSGKTTVARALSVLLKCDMLDLDSVISEQENQTVAELIQGRGESGFRRAESFALKAVLQRKAARIIALGGGAWTVRSNRDLIKEEKGLVIFLDAPFEICWRRIAEQETVRPLALDRSSAHKLYRERYSVYKLANLTISVSGDQGADELAAQIFAAMKRRRLVLD